MDVKVQTVVFWVATPSSGSNMTFQNVGLLTTYVLLMEYANSSKALMTTYMDIYRHSPDHNLNIEDLKILFHQI
jgi:hypothetical protein